MSMTPGELLIDEGEHTLNPGRRTHTLVVQNASDRPFKWARTTTLPKPTRV